MIPPKTSASHRDHSGYRSAIIDCAPSVWLQLKVRDRATTNRATQQHAKAKIESIETSATAGCNDRQRAFREAADFRAAFACKHFTLLDAHRPVGTDRKSVV